MSLLVRRHVRKRPSMWKKMKYNDRIKFMDFGDDDALLIRYS
jgi:hypothetical protein